MGKAFKCDFCGELYDFCEEANERKENEVYNGGDDTHD